MNRIKSYFLLGLYCHCQTWGTRAGWIVGFIDGVEATIVGITKRKNSCKVLIMDATRPDGSNDHRIVIPHGTTDDKVDSMIKAASVRADEQRL